MRGGSDLHPLVTKRVVRTRMISGLMVLIPLVITVLILKFVFTLMASFLEPVLEPFLRGVPQQVVTLISFVTFIGLIYLLGLIAAHVIGQRMISWGERLISYIPVAKTIYSASKQVIHALSASDKTALKSVAIFDFPYPGAKSIGFVTGTIMENNRICYYKILMPTTPNPTSGFLLFIPAENVVITDMTLEDGMKIVMSVGILGLKSTAAFHPPRRVGTD